MSLLRVIEVIEMLNSPRASGQAAAQYLHGLDSKNLAEIEVTTVGGHRGSTDFIRITLPGLRGKAALTGKGWPRSSDSDDVAPTLGIIGRLGGIGARPERLGLVSDGDGAIVALALAASLIHSAAEGDRLAGDVIIATHVCPNAPTNPHDPVPFMGSPVDMATMNRHEVAGPLDAVISVDATKGNRVLNTRGFAITPTIKEGYILRISEGLLDLMEYVTGRPPVVLPITLQDITPYGNDIYHVNSIMQPVTATDAPVVGVAVTAATAVPGCATGANQPVDLEETMRFCGEVAKAFTSGGLTLHDEDEFARLVSLYGSLRHLVMQPDQPDSEEDNS